MNLDLLRRLKAPELIVPGRKPPRSTDVRAVSDAHRIAYWPMREGAGHAIDEVSGKVLTLEGNTIWRGGSIYTTGGTTDYATAAISRGSTDHLTFAFEHTLLVNPSTDGILSWDPSSATSTTPVILFQGQSSSNIRLYVNGGYRINISHSVGTRYRWVITHDGSEWRVYQNGGLAGAWTGAISTSSGDKLWLGTGYIGRTIGLFDSFCYDDRAWTPDEVAAWSRDPNILLDFNSLYVWDEAGGGGVNLVIADSAHGHIADNLVLTQAHQLAVAESSHGHAADNIALTQAHALSVVDSAHGHAADNIDLSVSQELAVAEATHGHASDNIDLTQAHQLVIAESTHGHTAENIVLQAAGTLAVQDSVHGHIADDIALTQAHVLAIAESAHSHAAENLSLDSSAILTILDGAHGHSADNIALTQSYILSVQDALHNHAAENVGLDVDHATLIISDALHAHLADQCNVSEQITVIETPGERIFMIQAEGRVIAVTAGPRAFPIQ